MRREKKSEKRRRTMTNSPRPIRINHKGTKKTANGEGRTANGRLRFLPVRRSPFAVRRLVTLCLCGFFLLAFIVSALAQSSVRTKAKGSISGRVTIDGKGAPGL